MNPLEALADAISQYNGFMEPGSPLYLARNPGALRPMKPEQLRNDDGYRIFKSLLDGLQALHFDLRVKLMGRLSPDSTLSDLAIAYSRKPSAATAWAKYLRSALGDPTISARTPISRFLEDING